MRRSTKSTFGTARFGAEMILRTKTSSSLIVAQRWGAYRRLVWYAGPFRRSHRKVTQFKTEISVWRRDVERSSWLVRHGVGSAVLCYVCYSYRQKVQFHKRCSLEVLFHAVLTFGTFDFKIVSNNQVENQLNWKVFWTQVTFSQTMAFLAFPYVPVLRLKSK